jgi:hypothetical protein
MNVFWLDSEGAKTLSTDAYSSSSFWKGTLPTYREIIDIDDNSIASLDSFHSIEDDEGREGNPSTQDDMILSGSIVNLNQKSGILFLVISRRIDPVERFRSRLWKST